MNKVVFSLQEAVERAGLRNGMTISFHHHLREGDRVVKEVLQIVRKMGIRDLTLCATSLMNCHDFLPDFIIDGTIVQLDSSGLRGKLGAFIRAGGMQNPVVLRSHGGRARAVASGERKVDIAFIAASMADVYGNANGVQGKNAFGSLGYGIWESLQATTSVIVTDTLSPSILPHISISQSNTDIVAVIDSIGDSQLLKSGSLEDKADSISKVIAKNVSRFLLKSEIPLNHTSIQMGSGGITLQVIRYLKDTLRENGWKFQFAIGGITAHLIQMLQEGWVEALMDVQSFDTLGADSIFKNRNHHEIDVNTYANPDNPYCVVNNLDIAILSTLEIDLDWNCNVLTGSDGTFMGAIGGHPDVAESSKLTIITAPLIRERIPIVVDHVNTVVTRGRDVDVFICDWGIAIKPEHEHLIRALTDVGIAVFTLEELYRKALSLVGKPQKPISGTRNVAIVQDRRGGTL